MTKNEEIRRLRECAYKYLSWLNVTNPKEGLEKDLVNPEMVGKGDNTVTHTIASEKLQEIANNVAEKAYRKCAKKGEYVIGSQVSEIIKQSVPFQIKKYSELGLKL